ncbi:hypothetical protein M0D21_15530 [Aquimarina sp. D1M17]|uniref:hypothetical protein n=1 Tax=Aquimarina acroporae TaxID=2937283 RepID=UPI0020C0901E|nr:hypothetical protein [Aquimarina acroporae]MCK8522988.1 hypothetical protein [Aquimarina acroporae]
MRSLLIFKKLETNPKQLFVIDGLGALLSAILLGVVLVKFEEVFGIPKVSLYILAVFPLFFMVYDVFSYFQTRDKVSLLLRAIAIINVMYCGLSLGFGVYHFNSITYFGWLYIFVEVFIIIVLVLIELKVANRVSKKV